MKQWAESQQANILPVLYYHIVFNLPHNLKGWVQPHPYVIHRLLFQSAWYTTRTLDPKRLGGEMGMSAVLHTWGQNLSQHVHLHCLVPGDALGDDGIWRKARSYYLFPVRALSRHFHGYLVSALRKAANAGELHRIRWAGDVDDRLNAMMATEWVVYSKDCLEHTHAVVRHLARYTPQIAISNARILAVDDYHVALRYKRLPRPTQTARPRWQGVGAPLPAPRPAQGADAGPSLRFSGQSLPAATPGTTIDMSIQETVFQCSWHSITN